MARAPHQKPGTPPTTAPPPGDLGRLVARAPATLRVVQEARAAASTQLTTILLGETGTGKSVLAERMHAWSGRSGAFVEVNCANLAGSLAESELFGHERGAFTGADRPHEGRFREAHQGTLFLDEVGELPLEVQAKLLLAVDRGLVRPVGGRRDITADVFVIAATHRDLQAMVAAGTFREDLYHRLCGNVIDLPPLRDRVEEVGHLLAGIFAQHPRSDGQPWSLDEGALARLRAHRWPGNVRELTQIGRRLVTRAAGPVVSAADVVRALTPGEERLSPRAWVLQRLRSGPLGRAALFEGFASLVGSIGTLRRAIDALVLSQEILREGNGRATRYRLAEDGCGGRTPEATKATPATRRAAARAWLSRRGWVRSGQLAQALGVGTTTAKSLLRELLGEGLIEARGRGRGARVRWIGAAVEGAPAPTAEPEAARDDDEAPTSAEPDADQAPAEPRDGGSTLGGHRLTRRRPVLGDLTERERLALQIAARAGRVTRRALTGLGVPARSGSRVFGRLVGDGLIQPQGGRGWATGYVITPAGQELVTEVGGAPSLQGVQPAVVLRPAARMAPARCPDDPVIAERIGAAIRLAVEQGRLLLSALTLVTGPDSARRTLSLLVARGLLTELGPDEFALILAARPPPDEM